LVVNDLVVWITLDLLKMPFLFGKVVATGICVFWNFAARRIWVYRDQPT
jgi:putative flippase GtrA